MLFCVRVSVGSPSMSKVETGTRRLEDVGDLPPHVWSLRFASLFTGVTVNCRPRGTGQGVMKKKIEKQSITEYKEC